MEPLALRQRLRAEPPEPRQVLPRPPELRAAPLEPRRGPALRAAQRLEPRVRGAVARWAVELPDWAREPAPTLRLK